MFFLEYDFLSKINLDSESNISMYMALMVFENRVFVIGIYLDVSKAFDAVEHSILLMKLEYYGIRCIYLGCFKSYLVEKVQYVTYNGISSSTKFVKFGVPQGFISGPLLFLLYIHDLPNVCKSINHVSNADDANLFINGKILINLQTSIKSELEIISKWLKIDKLSLSVRKTNHVIFTH